MTDKIEIDFSKVLVSDYIEWVCADARDIRAFIDFADKAVIGGIKDRLMTELPVIFAKLVKALEEENASIAIAVASMQEYLKGNE